MLPINFHKTHIIGVPMPGNKLIKYHVEKTIIKSAALQFSQASVVTCSSPVRYRLNIVSFIHYHFFLINSARLGLNNLSASLTDCFRSPVSVG